MPSPHINLPGTFYTAEKSTILSVSPYSDDQATLRSILGDGGRWILEKARSLAEARKLLSGMPAAVLCERELADGTWKEMLSALRSEGGTPLVVTSSDADDLLWAEVLNLGGYDVLMKPFDAAEVTRVLGMACRHALRKPVMHRSVPLAQLAV